LARRAAENNRAIAGRVQFRYYNELSFEDILKDAAALPPHNAIFWLFMNVDGAGVTHESNSALPRLAAEANAPIFSHDGPFFGDGIVGGPMQSIPLLSKATADVALRILDGEKPADTKPTFVKPAPPIFDWRQCSLGNCRE